MTHTQLNNKFKRIFKIESLTRRIASLETFIDEVLPSAEDNDSPQVQVLMQFASVELERLYAQQRDNTISLISMNQLTGAEIFEDLESVPMEYAYEAV